MHPVVFRNDVLERIAFGDRLPEFLLDTDITERLDGPDDASPNVLQQGRGNADRQTTARSVHNMNGSVNDRFSRLNGPAQDAALLTDIRLENILATLSDGLFPAYACDFFRRPVERGDEPVIIDGKNTVGDRIEDDVLFHNFFITYLPPT